MYICLHQITFKNVFSFTESEVILFNVTVFGLNSILMCIIALKLLINLPDSWRSIGLQRPSLSRLATWRACAVVTSWRTAAAWRSKNEIEAERSCRAEPPETREEHRAAALTAPDEPPSEPPSEPHTRSQHQRLGFVIQSLEGKRLPVNLCSGIKAPTSTLTTCLQWSHSPSLLLDLLHSHVINKIRTLRDFSPETGRRKVESVTF